MEELVKKAMQHDGDAFVKLMRCQEQNMYKVARAIVKSDEDIADAMQDTVLVCWDKLCQLEEPRYFRTWMTKILINKCYSIIRKQQKLNVAENIPEVAVCDSGFQNIEWSQMMDSLRTKDRIIVSLYYEQGFKTSEIASILNIPESTVRGCMARSRSKLAAEYYPELKKET